MLKNPKFDVDMFAGAGGLMAFGGLVSGQRHVLYGGSAMAGTGALGHAGISAYEKYLKNRQNNAPPQGQGQEERRNARRSLEFASGLPL